MVKSDSEKDNTKKRMHIRMLLLGIVLIASILTLVMWILAQRKKVSYSVSDYDMGQQRDVSEKDVEDVYKKSSSDALQKSSEIRLEKHLNEKKVNKYISKTEHILKLVRSEDKEKLEKLINRDAVTQKGYETDGDMISRICSMYGSDHVLMPISFIDYHSYAYCILRNTKASVSDSGEACYEYGTAYETITFTIYEDGSFLPFALDAMSVSGMVHRNDTAGTTTPDPSLLDGLPKIPGLDEDIDDPGL